MGAAIAVSCSSSPVPQICVVAVIFVAIREVTRKVTVVHCPKVTSGNTDFHMLFNMIPVTIPCC